MGQLRRDTTAAVAQRCDKRDCIIGFGIFFWHQTVARELERIVQYFAGVAVVDTQDGGAAAGLNTELGKAEITRSFLAIDALCIIVKQQQ